MLRLMRASVALACLFAVSPAIAAKDSVVIGMTLEPPTLDPTTGAAAAIGQVVHYNVFEGLTRINEDFSVTPLLADSWTLSPDAKTFTFKLKSSVKFQNGEPLTVDDVKFSFERAAAADSTNKDKAFFASDRFHRHARSAETIVIAFKQPSFAALFHFGQNTAVILEPKSAPTDATNPVGTGPYKLGSWNRGASLTLDKWDGFRDPAKSIIEHATFKFINDAAAQTAAVLAGDVDAYPLFGALESLGQFKGNPKYQVTIGGSEGKTIVGINNKRKPFDDLRVRQAIAYAIDRNAIIEGAMSGMGAPIGSHAVPTDPGYVDLTGQYPHDPAKAKALLKAAGVTAPLNLTLTLPPPPYARQSGEIVAAELREVGIEAKIVNVEWAQWLSGVFKGKDFDLTIISHVEPLDIGVYANPDYYFQYDSQAFRDINAKLAAAPDINAFKAAMTAAQKKIADDCVNAFLFQLPQVGVADAKLSGLWKDSPIFETDLSALAWK